MERGMSLTAKVDRSCSLPERATSTDLRRMFTESPRNHRVDSKDRDRWGAHRTPRHIGRELDLAAHGCSEHHEVVAVAVNQGCHAPLVNALTWTS
jgi:hypothetical protein